MTTDEIKIVLDELVEELTGHTQIDPTLPLACYFDMVDLLFVLPREIEASFAIVLDKKILPELNNYNELIALIQKRIHNTGSKRSASNDRPYFE